MSYYIKYLIVTRSHLVLLLCLLLYYYYYYYLHVFDYNLLNFLINYVIGKAWGSFGKHLEKRDLFKLYFLCIIQLDSQSEMYLCMIWFSRHGILIWSLKDFNFVLLITKLVKYLEILLSWLLGYPYPCNSHFFEKSCPSILKQDKSSYILKQLRVNTLSFQLYLERKDFLPLKSAGSICIR